MKFLTGGAIGLAMHEGGHLLFDGLFDARPQIKNVRFGPVPFFAIVHRPDLSPRREFVVSSAGLWVHNGTNEWLLTTRPGLRQEHAPWLKGILAFNVITSVGYGGVALARAGPVERDTRGIAESARLDERTVGALVMAPAILDAYRYYRPGAAWPKWASRALKVGAVLLILR